MKEALDVVRHDNRNYFRLMSGEKIFLLEHLDASDLINSEVDDGYNPFEVMRNGSILSLGHCYYACDIDPVYLIDYSEIPEFYSCNFPNTLYPSSLQPGDIVYSDIYRGDKYPNWISTLMMLDGTFKQFTDAFRKLPNAKVDDHVPLVKKGLPHGFIDTPAGIIVKINL